MVGSLRPMILGSSAGTLMELVVEERQKKEIAPKTLLDLSDYKHGTTICAIFQVDFLMLTGKRAAL